MCGLCMDNFRVSDTVMDCHKGHVFHLQCFEQQTLHAQQNVCPSCGQSMHLFDDSHATLQESTSNFNRSSINYDMQNVDNDTFCYEKIKVDEVDR